MEDRILGLHHITAIAGNAQRNYDFYTRVLGLRLVKKTVNFDDPGTYHFYFGNETGTPGTILTFFPWEGIGAGRTGTGMATDIGYSVPAESLEWWKDRFKQLKISCSDERERFGEKLFSFRDPDGLHIDWIAPAHKDVRKPWVKADVPAGMATRGFHSVTLTVRKLEPTAKVLTDILGYRLEQQEGNRYRFKTDAVDNAAIVDICELPEGNPGHNAGGTNHHVAFRVKDDNILMEYRELIARRGFNITPKIDRDYFFSLYFREPGGVLFELATDNPGFMRDEPLEALGTELKLPQRYEAARAKIESVLPPLH